MAYVVKSEHVVAEKHFLADLSSTNMSISSMPSESEAVDVISTTVVGLMPVAGECEIETIGDDEPGGFATAKLFVPVAGSRPILPAGSRAVA